MCVCMHACVCVCVRVDRGFFAGGGGEFLSMLSGTHSVVSGVR